MNKISAIASKFLVVTALVTGMYSCKKDETPSNIVAKSGIPVQGAQEVPVRTTSATGSVDVSYNKTTKVLTYTGNWSGLTTPVTGMHFHGPADRGVNASVIVPITNYPAGTSGTVSGTVTLDEVTLKEADLLGGKWYYNVHTSTFTGGEIRGQIEF